ncbi:Ig-like domain-containing protein [Spongiimicrobium salis]|uniref:Ig-like domain-containing protein n=1 Tax=Spongiimicrobium salis TaxID=1667022 RepID=UPI00374D4178
MVQRILGCLFIVVILFSIVQCARRGTPSGGEKDETPPVLVRAVPENMSVNFSSKKIRLYFDEFIKLKDVQNQLIVSPPLKYPLEITPQGSPRKFIEIKIKDTLRENTTYTFNFGQSVEDNNEGNANSFLSYIFSTGTYIDSLSILGVVKDAYDKEVDPAISVMLYEIDSMYTDSTIFKRPPNYITNTQDSTNIFELKNLKAGKYFLMALQDISNNNLFDQNADKIGFLADTITVPSDSIYLLNLFKEIPNYSASVPSFESRYKIIFGYLGAEETPPIIETLTELPDSLRTLITKEPEKDSLNYWISPFNLDSIVFKVTNEQLQVMDTFSVKSRKIAADSLVLTPNQRSTLSFEKAFNISATTPITAVDTTKISMMDKDSIAVAFTTKLDRIKNKVDFDFEHQPEQRYNLSLLPGAITDFYGEQNDTLEYRLSTRNYTDYGNVRLTITGAEYPLIIHLLNSSEEIEREIYATETQGFEFKNLDLGTYTIKVIFDTNGNGKWDTGNFLEKRQPERVSHYPKTLEVRANWDQIENFIIPEQ